MEVTSWDYWAPNYAEGEAVLHEPGNNPNPVEVAGSNLTFEVDAVGNESDFDFCITTIAEITVGPANFSTGTPVELICRNHSKNTLGISVTVEGEVLLILHMLKA